MGSVIRRSTVTLFVMALMVAACGGASDESTTTTPSASTTTTTVAASTTTVTEESGVVSGLKGLRGAVVRITAEGGFVDPEEGQASGGWSGSGFIIDPSGIAVTNNHVVTGAAFLQVYVDGEDGPRNAKILGVSECSDLAVIDIDGAGFPHLEGSTLPSSSSGGFSGRSQANCGRDRRDRACFIRPHLAHPRPIPGGWSEWRIRCVGPGSDDAHNSGVDRRRGSAVRVDGPRPD